MDEANDIETEFNKKTTLIVVIAMCYSAVFGVIILGSAVCICMGGFDGSKDANNIVITCCSMLTFMIQFALNVTLVALSP